MRNTPIRNRSFARRAGTTIIRRYENIEVSDNLEIELVPGSQDAPALPMLCGLEVARLAKPDTMLALENRVSR